MTNSEARKRMQDRSGPESPLSSPHTANLGDGANGRLSEAERAELLDAGLGRKFRMNALQMLIVERIVREHTERAWDEGMAFGQQHWATNYGINGRVAPNPYRAARQEQNR